MDINKYLFNNQIYKKDFCEMLNISRPHFSLICNYKRRPSFKLIKKIAEYTEGKVTAKDWKMKFDAQKSSTGKMEDKG